MTKLLVVAGVVLFSLPAAAQPSLRVGLLGGVARTLEDTPRHGGLGHLRAQIEGCEDGFLCAVNLSMVGAYGLENAGGFEQWVTFDLGLRMGPMAVYSLVGFSWVIADVDHDDLNISAFSPRAGAGVRVDLEDVTILAEAHVDYLWRWFGDDVPVAGLQVGFLLPTRHEARPVEVREVETPPLPGPATVQVAQ